MQKSEVRGQISETRRQRAEGRKQHTLFVIRHPSSAVCRLSSVVCPSRGQAMVEFMVGLVVMLVLLAGLIQIGQLTHAHTRTMAAARAAAGQLAMAPTLPASETALLISDWVPGADQRRNTRDDMALVTSNAATLPGELVGQAHLEWVPNAPVNALSTLKASLNPAGDFFLVKGEASESVSILPIIRRLVYAHSTLEVESDAWLVWTEGIY